MILVLLRTGMRIGELLQLTMNDVRLAENKILIWEGEKNELWIDGTLVARGEKEETSIPNPLGYPPFAVAIAPAGFFFRDKDHLRYDGEDILFMARDLYDEYATDV